MSDLQPKELLHELEEGERIGEDIKKFLKLDSPPPRPAGAWPGGYNIDSPYQTDEWRAMLRPIRE